MQLRNQRGQVFMLYVRPRRRRVQVSALTVTLRVDLSDAIAAMDRLSATLAQASAAFAQLGRAFPPGKL